MLLMKKDQHLLVFMICGDADFAIGSSLVKINYSFTSLDNFSKLTKYPFSLYDEQSETQSELYCQRSTCLESFKQNLLRYL